MNIDLQAVALRRRNRSVSCILLTALWFFMVPSVQAAVPAEERQALVDLYNSTNGASWTTSTNWLTGDPCIDNWYGITCSATNANVIWLTLGFNNLDGSIPTSVGSMSLLRRIFLDGNSLTGAIPASLGNLSDLQALYLDDNSLSGSIPTELSNLSSLSLLHLNDNSLTGAIPLQLGNLGLLQNLYLDGNALTGAIPPEIGNLSELQRLNLDRNQLAGRIPSALGNLNNLTKMDLHSNRLCGHVPATLTSLTNLIDGDGVNLNDNYLQTSVSTELDSFLSLKGSAYSDWKTTQQGLCPAERDALITIYNSLDGTNWDNNSNWLAGDPCTNNWYGITCNADNANVTEFDLHSNSLNGSIPSAIGELNYLQSLRLDNNSLSGTIPSEIGNLRQLQTLHVSSNSLAGPLPTELRNLRQLQMLDLSSNSFDGFIPDDLRSLTQLQTLNLGSNSFMGSIPADLGNLGQLQYLYLAENELCGIIPTMLSNLVNLVDGTGLDLNNNNLSTRVGTALDNFISLKSSGFTDWKTTQGVVDFCRSNEFHWSMFMPAISKKDMKKKKK